MRNALSFALMMTATVALSEDTVSQTAATISEADCLAYAEVSDLIAQYRQEGKSEKRTTRILTRGRRAVDERLHPGVPTLVNYFYSLPEEAVVPGAAGDAFKASCLPPEKEDTEATE